VARVEEQPLARRDPGGHRRQPDALRQTPHEGEYRRGTDVDAGRAAERLALRLVVTARSEKQRGEVAELDLFRIGQLDELSRLTLVPCLDVEGARANLWPHGMDSGAGAQLGRGRGTNEEDDQLRDERARHPGARPAAGSLASSPPGTRGRSGALPPRQYGPLLP
jgi:hypothetical protein